jgi:integrase
MRFKRTAYEVGILFQERELVPTQADFKKHFMMLRYGEPEIDMPKPVKTVGTVRKSKKTISEDADIRSSKPGQKTVKTIFNKKTAIVKHEPFNKSLNFWVIAHEFERQCGRQNNWTEATYEKFHAMRNHLKGLRERKRKLGLKTFDFDFDFFEEEGLLSYMEYLRDVKNMKNSTIEKHLEFLRWFLRWSLHKGFHSNNCFETFRPKFKKTQKKVVFLTKQELETLENYEIPETKLYLYRVRDVFLFCCFTGLRHSDVFNLKRCDVKEDHIEVTTIKTFDSLRIELNDHSRAILEKYEPYSFPDDKALPVISNQRMNVYLHELCKLAGLNEKIRQTYYRGNERIDVVKPKYELIGTHTGRRTFICNALGMGISPQIVMKWTGHSDYKAMKPYIDVADDIKAEAMKKFNQF